MIVENRSGIRSIVNVLACLRIMQTEDVYDSIDDTAMMRMETVRAYFHTSRVEYYSSLYGSALEQTTDTQ